MTIYYDELKKCFVLKWSLDVNSDYPITGFKTYNEAVEYYNKQVRRMKS